MKKILLLVGLGTWCSYATAQQKDITGIWEGKLNVGVELRLVFHFEKNASGYTGSIDSPDQGAKGIPMTRVDVSAENVTAEISSIHGTFSARMQGDSLLAGNWSQGPAVLPVKLKRVQHVSELRRPQTPRPPFTYNSTEVEYDNADRTVHFAGTLTFPKTGGPFPAALMITGSGSQDRDETLFEHKPFAVIADYLTRKGYAVLRLDDRGMGKTTGDVKGVTSADFANDVEAGLTYLNTRDEIDQHKIGLIGHSEGGLIASIVAARNKRVDFVIMLAGPGVKGADVLADQGEAVLNSSGIAREASAAYKPMYRQFIEYAITSKDSASAMGAAYPAFLLWQEHQTPAVVQALNLTSEVNNKKMIGALLKQLGSPWMKYFLMTDPHEMIRKFRCKVLALNGSKDIQVLPASNLAGIKEALAKSKSRTYEVKQLEGLNHLFQHCTKCSVQEYGQLEETFAPEALEVMGQWLDKNVLH